MNLFNVELEGYVPLEIYLYHTEDFLTIRETLTRIGIASYKTKTLYQSCHIFHKQGIYYICGFKELLSLDGKETNISYSDLSRRNTIASLLEEWGLLEIAHPEHVNEFAPLSSIKIIPFKEKSEWKLVEKYRVGKVKRS